MTKDPKHAANDNHDNQGWTDCEELFDDNRLPPPPEFLLRKPETHHHLSPHQVRARLLRLFAVLGLCLAFVLIWGAIQ